MIFYLCTYIYIIGGFFSYTFARWESLSRYIPYELSCSGPLFFFVLLALVLHIYIFFHFSLEDISREMEEEVVID